MRAVVIDAAALNVLQRSPDLPENWVEQFSLPADHPELRSICENEIQYILAKGAPPIGRALFIKIEEGKLFSGVEPEHRMEALDRCVKVTLSFFEPTVIVPSHWKPFNRGSVFAFQSNSRASGETARILIDRSPPGGDQAYAFDLTTRQKEFLHSKPDLNLFLEAKAAFLKIVGQHPEKAESTVQRRTVDLSGRLPQGFTYGLSLNDWYQSKLTKQQREFVDFPMTQSVRLRGPAGTGKTIALVVKFLCEINKKIEKGAPFRFAFLTHSSATAELVGSIMLALDTENILGKRKQDQHVVITTLLDLANQAIAYDLHELTPLSPDGLEGRTLQMELLSAILQTFKNSSWITWRSKCSEPFRMFIESEVESPSNKVFCWEVLNEFACVLDAEGVRDSRERRDKYLSEKRRAWMMQLETIEERQVILELYTEFRKILREMKTVGVDQMISDYLGYLDSFRWDAVRQSEGFDAVFVDELHLFNRQERLAFHQMMRDGSAQPVVLMAYDAKQSPRDTFVGLQGDEVGKYDFWRDARLGKVEKIDLQDVFRYTPQIANALHNIDQSFPAADLEEEWLPFSGRSQLKDGPIPTVTEVGNALDQYKLVFDRASEAARRIGVGRRVAVLSLNYETFDAYLKAMNYRDRFISITSREQFSEISRAGKRFIYSMPEFIAGLQFDIVFLLDANEIDSGGSIGSKRRFASSLYLGASRAAYALEIYARAEMKGISEAFRLAINSKAILPISADDLPRIDQIVTQINKCVADNA